MTPDVVMRELAGLHALARSLVHGDDDADDLLQETAIAAMQHPPDEDRPVRPWLATVLRNRWRMDRRGRSRREAREHAVGLDLVAESRERDTAPDAIDRARTLERLASALVALDEPFRDVVIRRYLDGQSAADIARALKIPAGTVRWRLKTGLDRLRAALDESTPRWQRALLPMTAFKGAAVVKAKTSIFALVAFLLLVGGGIAFYVTQRGSAASQPGAVAATGSARRPGLAVAERGAVAIADGGVAADPLPGQGRVRVEPFAGPGGAIGGRVINWSTGDGVAGAELTFDSASGASTVRAGDDGTFELAAPEAGRYSLTTVVAQGFLPYAPELQHSPVRIVLGAKQAVRGLTLYLFPAVDYVGTVVDAQGAPVSGARIKLADPTGEQTLERIVSEWTSDSKGQFVFHAADFSVFEASRGNERGWAILDGNVALTRKLTIKLGEAPARDARIRGKTVDASGAPLADVLVTAVPTGPGEPQSPRAVAFATSGADGSFVLEGLDRKGYDLIAEDESLAQARRENVAGGTERITLTLEAGLPLAGIVRDANDQPVPAYTLLVTRRQGVMRDVVTTRSVIDPTGHFDVRVAKGDYELLVSANGWAPSAPYPISAGTTDARIDLNAGATLVGSVVDSVTGAPLGYARITREGAGGGASTQPANAGTVTRSDGTFELTGIPAGPLSISIGAGNYNPRLESGLVATEGATIGPIRVPLKKLAEGETPKLELVGIGVQLAGEGDALKVSMVVPDGGASKAGIVVGDLIVAVDGVPVTTLGTDGTVSRIRGMAHTTVSVTLKRGDQLVPLVVERLPLRF